MPYNLPALVGKNRKHPFRPIRSLQSQAATISRPYLALVAAWSTTAASLMPAYAQATQTGDMTELATEQDNKVAEIALILLLLSRQFRPAFTAIEQWHRDKWLGSVKAASGVDVAPYLDMFAGVPTIASVATVPASGGIVAAAKAASSAIEKGFAQVGYIVPETYPISAVSGEGLIAGAGSVTNEVNSLAPQSGIPPKPASSAKKLATAPISSSTTAYAKATAPVSALVNNAVLQNEVLLRSVSADIRARVASVLFNGVQRQLPAETVARQIREVLQKAGKRGKRIAVEESKNIVRDLNKFRQQEADLGQFEWLHGDSKVPRPVHLARDHKIYGWNDPRLSELPGVLINCSCWARPVWSTN